MKGKLKMLTGKRERERERERESEREMEREEKIVKRNRKKLNE